MQTSDHTVATPEALASISLEELNRQSELGQWPVAWLAYAAGNFPALDSALLAVNNGQTMRPIAAWPPQQSHTQLTELLQACIDKQQALVMPLDDGALGIAYPIINEATVQAVFVCQLGEPPKDITGVLSSLEKSCVWLQYRFNSELDLEQQDKVARQKFLIDSFTALGKGESLSESALHWIDCLARNFCCDRVSLAEVSNNKAELQLISGSSDHALNSQTTKLLQAAMQEACDQHQLLVWPLVDGSSQSLITLQSEKLSLAHHNACLLVVPVVQQDQTYLCLLFERPADAAFEPEECEQIESHLALAGVAYNTKRESVYSPLQVLRRSLKKQLEHLLGPGHVKRKLFALGALFLLIFFCLVEGDYEVNAEAELEPMQVRIISAPLSGYIKTSQLRAGDRIKQGDVLLEMEDRELRLERIKSISSLSRANKQYSEALAARDRAKAQIYNAQMEQAKARLAAADSQLQRSLITAPYPALLLSGDLRQRIGGSVSQGEELFRLSPMESYQLILFVDEYKINDISVNQTGRVVLSSMPDAGIDFKVSAITPITEVRDGGTVFRVEASLGELHGDFRPGMVGIAKVMVDQRLLIDIWTADLRKWASMKLWSFWG